MASADVTSKRGRHYATWRSESPEYAAWRNMRARCSKPNRKDFARYGGRGIRVCPEWEASFDAFVLDVGRRPSPRHSLDRIDNDGHYEPGNVRWATAEEQNRNRRDNRLVVFQGREMTMVEAIAASGLKTLAVYRRLAKGWDALTALTTPTDRANAARARWPNR